MQGKLYAHSRPARVLSAWLCIPMAEELNLKFRSSRFESEYSYVKTTYDDIQRKATLSSGQTIHAFHKSTSCSGSKCPVHAPTSHRYSDLPLEYDFVIGSFFRKLSDSERTVDPDDYTLNTVGTVILVNAVECMECLQTIESTYRHDFVTCSCGNVSVDGGHNYLRRVGSSFIDKSHVVLLEEVSV